MEDRAVGAEVVVVVVVVEVTATVTTRVPVMEEDVVGWEGEEEGAARLSA